MQEFKFDNLDTIAAEAFEEHIIRKDLIKKFVSKYPVPTYVFEALLGRLCASTNPDKIQNGLDIVERQLNDSIVPSGEEERFKRRARETGSVKIIDKVSARLDDTTGSYVATIPSLHLKNVTINETLVNERMLLGGFYLEIDLSYDAAQESKVNLFSITSIRPIQIPKPDILNTLYSGRNKFNSAEWKDFLLRSIGLEPSAMTNRNKDILLLRMVPFVENNYNLIEVGPRATGKSHLYQQISSHSLLVSGGKATVARMFVDNNSGRKGLVCLYDVVCFDEASDICFDQKDGVSIMKGYMESGEFTRGMDTIRSFGSIVILSNLNIDVKNQQRIEHLFDPMPPEMRDDTAIMDRIHCYLPGWDIPKVSEGIKTTHFGLVSDFLSECWTRLRSHNRLSILQGKVVFGSALSRRDQNAVSKTINGLIKLLHPSPDKEIPDDDLEWAIRLALECRRRVKEQQKRIGSYEFHNTQFSYTLAKDGVEKFVATPELQSDDYVETDPSPKG
jgi:ATP-dependent Lon protease